MRLGCSDPAAPRPLRPKYGRLGCEVRLVRALAPEPHKFYISAILTNVCRATRPASTLPAEGALPTETSRPHGSPSAVCTAETRSCRTISRHTLRVRHTLRTLPGHRTPSPSAATTPPAPSASTAPAAPATAPAWPDTGSVQCRQPQLCCHRCGYRSRCGWNVGLRRETSPTWHTWSVSACA